MTLFDVWVLFLVVVGAWTVGSWVGRLIGRLILKDD
jgi:hypothetical protein